MSSEILLESPNPPVSDGTDLTADNHHENGTGGTEHGPYHSHWASVIGAFKDDPMLDVMMENIRQRRREIDADENVE